MRPPVGRHRRASGRTELRYDLDGQIVAQVLPTGEAATWEYDACARVIRRRVPGVGTTSISYDAAGRVAESRDPQLKRRRRFVYDDAGQLVQAVNGNGGVNRWEYDANGGAVDYIDPDGGVTRREFDAMNHLVAETDPLGRRTTAGYDDAGRQVWQVSADGVRTEWTYDEAGRPKSVLTDGRVVSSISRDIRGRSVRVTDHTRADVESIHELRWNAGGQLVSRTRDGHGLTWEYDADGRRTGRVGPDGYRVSYERDAAGRVTAMAHPLLGALRSRTTPPVVWWRPGRGAAADLDLHRRLRQHPRDQRRGTHGSDSQCRGPRRGAGRVVALNRDGAHTAYSYDEACQLIEARTNGQGGEVARWRYDPAGRLVRRRARDGTTRVLAYDAAGGLVSSELDGRVLTYSYDQQGRRTSVSDAESTREFGWSLHRLAGQHRGPGRGRRAATGHGRRRRAGRAVPARRRRGVLRHRRSLRLARRFGDSAVVAAGAVTGVGEEWATPGWRGVRTDSSDPWETPAVGVGPAAACVRGPGVAGRAPSVRPCERVGFLSVRPARPGSRAQVGPATPTPTPATTRCTPSDPTGLRPATDAELTAYAASHQGGVHAAGSLAGEQDGAQVVRWSSPAVS